jgi:hypothetical protein
MLVRVAQAGFGQRRPYSLSGLGSNPYDAAATAALGLDPSLAKTDEQWAQMIADERAYSDSVIKANRAAGKSDPYSGALPDYMDPWEVVDYNTKMVRAGLPPGVQIGAGLTDHDPQMQTYGDLMHQALSEYNSTHGTSWGVGDMAVEPSATAQAKKLLVGAPTQPGVVTKAAPVMTTPSVTPTVLTQAAQPAPAVAWAPIAAAPVSAAPTITAPAPSISGLLSGTSSLVILGVVILGGALLLGGGGKKHAQAKES